MAFWMVLMITPSVYRLKTICHGRKDNQSGCNERWVWGSLEGEAEKA